MNDENEQFQQIEQAEQQQHDQNSQQRKQKPKINPVLKFKLIESVLIEELSVYKASKRHKINYSTAKHIVKQFSEDLPNILRNYRKEKQALNQSLNQPFVKEIQEQETEFIEHIIGMSYLQEMKHNITIPILNSSELLNMTNDNILQQNEQIQQRIRGLKGMLEYQQDQMKN